MTEYSVLHHATTAACLLLFLLLVRRGLFAYFVWFSVYLLVSGLSGLVTSSLLLYDPAWWRQSWLPVTILRTAVSLLISLSLFDFLRSRVLRVERQALALGALALAGALVLSLLWWRPANWFQSAVAVRQYVFLAHAVAFTFAWVYLLYLRPVQTPPLLRQLGVLWSWWLWGCWLGSTTGAGGLLWLLVDREGNYAVLAWRVVSDMSFTWGITILIAMAISLRPRHTGSWRRRIGSR